MFDRFRRFAKEDPILPAKDLIQLIRSGGIRFDVRTKDEKWTNVVDMFQDRYSTPWVHPQPRGLRVKQATLSNVLTSYAHGWMVVEYDDDLKWHAKKFFNAFPQTCRNEATIRALQVPGESILGLFQHIIFNRHTPGVANIFSSSSSKYTEAPWIVKMYNAREEPRPPQPHHMIFLPEKFRPSVLLDRRILASPSQREMFR